MKPYEKSFAMGMLFMILVNVDKSTGWWSVPPMVAALIFIVAAVVEFCAENFQVKR